MAEKHPYASPGAVAAAVNQFKKSFPAKISADTLRKLAIAPNNESYVINALRFIGAIDAEGNKTEKATAVFNLHDQETFQQAFGGMIKSAYSELFNLRGEEAWVLSQDGLIAFFRQNDQSSDLVGRRQASTFQVLAGLAGHGEPKAITKLGPKGIEKAKEKKLRVENGERKTFLEPTPVGMPAETASVPGRDVGLPGLLYQWDC